MLTVVISVGANCGDRENNVKATVDWLKSILIQFSASDIYETPCARKSGKAYMNAVVKGVFQGTGIQLEEMLKDKEHEMGRTAESRLRGDVPIDIDIVILNNEVVKPWDARQKFFSIGLSQIQ